MGSSEGLSACIGHNLISFPPHLLALLGSSPGITVCAMDASVKSIMIRLMG